MSTPKSKPSGAMMRQGFSGEPTYLHASSSRLYIEGEMDKFSRLEQEENIPEVYNALDISKLLTSRVFKL